MITYQRAMYKDLQALVDLRMEFLAEVNRTGTSMEDIHIVRQNFTSYLKEHMPKDEFIAWLAFDGENIVATSGLSFYQRPPSFMIKTGKCAYIMNMYTKSEYRGLGIAKELFQHMINEAKNKGCEYINLHATELGRPVYEKFGFVLTEDEMRLIL